VSGEDGAGSSSSLSSESESSVPSSFMALLLSGGECRPPVVGAGWSLATSI
jgi:hypothetical protein